MANHIRPLCEIYSNVIATPTVVKLPPDGSISGCLYTQEGKAIHLSQRVGGVCGDFFPSIDQDTIVTIDIASLPIVEGRCLYLGHFMPHYGHFLIEMLSSFWTFDTFHSFDYFIFHPFVFGESFSSYIIQAFQAFGIPLEKVKIIKTKTLIKEIAIPERLVKLNKSAKPEVAQVYSFLRQFFVSNSPISTVNANKRYYFSRVRTSLKSGQRAIINEPFLENALNRIGFISVYPELLSFSEQIILIQQAKVICGLSGSALHNCVFMQPESLLIEIADIRSANASHPMQQICNELSQATTYFISFAGYVLHQEKRVGIINSRKVVTQIAKILSDKNLNIEITKNVDRGFIVFADYFQIRFLMITKNLLRLLKWWITPKNFSK